MESSRTVVRGMTARLVASRVCSLPLRMALVPRGTEAGRIDWDTELAYLLSQN